MSTLCMECYDCNACRFSQSYATRHVTRYATRHVTRYVTRHVTTCHHLIGQLCLRVQVHHLDHRTIL